MASISAADLAQEILHTCLRDGTWPSRALDALVERALDDSDLFTAKAATRALFSIVIERLGDLFEPELCDVYAKLFSHVIARALPTYDSAELFLRYRNIRRVRPFQGGEIERVYVLSRVTLGADIAVTSVAMNAAKQRFPEAEIYFVGPDKNAALFSDDVQVFPIPVAYGRSSLLRERILAALELKTVINETASIVIDPDSRLTQLGLIPICDDARYYFFESRGFGGTDDKSLSELTSEWLEETFGVPHAHAYLRPAPQMPIAEITVSLGVGENENKRLGDEFEHRLISFLLQTGRSVMLDRGAGAEEAERVNALADALGRPGNLHLHDGGYASFASHILQSKLYIGYDSAGQHVACAGEVPLVSIFAGHVSQRMFDRWRPTGSHAHVIRIEPEQGDDALGRACAAIAVAVGAEA